MGLPKHPATLPLIPMLPTLYSYIVARDYGFAPNPFYGFCTLATCKPDIRRAAKIGDWVLGTGAKSKGRADRIVYAMCVTEAMTFDVYWEDIRFLKKRPNLRGSCKQTYGDNIYYRDYHTNERRQMDSHHTHEYGIQDLDNIRTDTSADRVLISNDFVYWGGSGPQIPLFRGESICHSTQKHKCKFPEEVVQEFINWIRSFDDRGYCGTPLEWG